MKEYINFGMNLRKSTIYNINNDIEREKKMIEKKNIESKIHKKELIRLKKIKQKIKRGKDE